MFDFFNWKKDDSVNTDFDAVNQRPALAIKFAQVIALWANLELNLSELLSAMLNADAVIGATLFSVITAEGGRLAMIRAVSEERLTQAHHDEYIALQKRVKSVGAYRDGIAHGIWGVSDKHPDILILLDSRQMARHGASQVASDAGVKVPADKLYFPHDTARMYGQREFDFIVSELLSLIADVNKMYGQLRRYPV